MSHLLTFGAAAGRPNRHRRLPLAAGTLVVVCALLAGTTPQAAASSWGSRTLAIGATGDDVKELQIRVAGWFNNCVANEPCYKHFRLDGKFGPMTERAVRNFQKAHGVAVTGRMDQTTYAKLEQLEDPDGTTRHFTFTEFAEKSSECSTVNRGTFNGGVVPAYDTQQYVRKLMWRLETTRRKMNDAYPVVVWSGYRSREYQSCLRNKHGRKVASTSQHSYGTAYDGVMTGINQGRQRGLAKTSQFHGIFCYSGGDSHNHLDIRLDNEHQVGNAFVWPKEDSQGRDLAGDNRVCYGGHASPPSTGVMSPAVGLGVPDPWGALSDPAGPTQAEAHAKAVAPEEGWLMSDDAFPEIPDAICNCMAATVSTQG